MTFYKKQFFVKNVKKSKKFLSQHYLRDGYAANGEANRILYEALFFAEKNA